MINQMDNANDINTILKASGIHKSFAQKALKNSNFSNNADIVLKGLKDSKGGLVATGTVLKTCPYESYDLDSRRRYCSHWQNDIQSHGI